LKKIAEKQAEPPEATKPDNPEKKKVVVLSR
jgi:hypothetical protein